MNVQPTGGAEPTASDGHAPAEQSQRVDLGAAIRGGMIWNLLSFVLSQGSAFAIFLVLASKLPPDIFGVVALASILADFVATDGRYACMDAIMQSGRYDKPSLNSAFLAFFGLSVVFALVMLIAAEPVSVIYGSPLIAAFMPLFGLMILPIPWLSVMDALLSRDLAFKQMTQRAVVGTLAGGVAGIAVAFSPWTIWALLVQRIVALVATMLSEYQYTRWIPGLTFHWKTARGFMRRFLPLWAISGLGEAGPRLVTMCFGIRFDGFTVGLLRAANRISESVQGPLINPMMALWFPLMSKVRGDIEGERQVYASLTRTVAFLVFPAFTGLILVAEDVVDLFLPDRYAGVAPLMEVVAMVTMAAPITWFSGIAMAALGMNRASLIYTASGVVGSLVALIVAPKVSAPLLFLLASAPIPLIAIVGVAVVNRRLKQSNLQYYAGLLPPALATAAMAAGVITLQQFLGGVGEVANLIACAVTGAAIYAGWLFVLHRSWLNERIKTLTGLGLARSLRTSPPPAAESTGAVAAEG
jgi:O-antigen/teichoic acid export membrane protein